MTLRFEDGPGARDERTNSVSVRLPAEAALYLSAELGRQALAIEAEVVDEAPERRRLI